MKIEFLGSGSAFSLVNGQSNMVIHHRGSLGSTPDKLFIDAGTDFRHMLKDAGYSYKDVKHLFISHVHADHIGGLEYLGFCSYFDPTCEKPNLYISSSLVNTLWNNSLCGGLGSIQGKVMGLDDYFNVIPIKRNETFEIGHLAMDGIEYQVVQVVHVMDGFTIKSSFGLIFRTKEGKKIFITTDTQFNPNQIRDFYKMSDTIFHDAETSKFMSGVHAHYDELVTLAPDIKNKMWLYHYQDGELPDAEGDGFRGFVKKGQIIEL